MISPGSIVSLRRALFAFVVSVVLVAVLVSPAWASVERGHVYGSTFGASGSGDGQLDKPQGIAVNEETGRVYVADSANNRVEFFSSKGVYEGQFNGSGTLANEKGVAAPEGMFAHVQQIAVDNSRSASDPSRGDVYVPVFYWQPGNATTVYDAVYKYTADGEYVGAITSTPECVIVNSQSVGEPIVKTERPCQFVNWVGVAVDPVGRLWVTFSPRKLGSSFVASFSNAVGNVYEREAKLVDISTFSNLNPALAVDARDDLFSNDGHAGVDEVSPSGGMLVRGVCGERPSRWPAVELGTGDVYMSEGGGWLRCGSDGVSVIESGPEGRLTAAAGIAVDSRSEEVFVVDEAKGDVVVFGPESPGAPTVTETHASAVDASTATLGGRINPRSEPGEAGTVYRFEYGRCSSVGECGSAAVVEGWRSAGGGVLGAGFEASSVATGVEGLVSGSAYRYRLVAENAIGRTIGSERVLLTEPVSSPFALPDGREWELVTPADALGARPLPIGFEGVTAWASVDGDRFAFETDQPTEEGVKGFAGAYYVEQVLGSRGVGGGWGSVDISPSRERVAGGWIGLGEDGRFFSEDLSKAIIEPPGAFSIPMGGGVSEAFPEPTGHTPYVRHNSTCAQTPASCFEPLLSAASEGGDVGERVNFGGSVTAMVGNTRFAAATGDLSHVLLDSSVALLPGAGTGLYEWADGALGYVGEGALPEGRRGVISEDGSRVFFIGRAEGKEELLLRDTVTGKSVQLDAGEEKCVLAGKCGSGGGVFQLATPDGSRVFFSDLQKLTASSGAGDLYECAIREEGGRPSCALRDLTVPAVGGEAVEVQGDVLASNDGSYLYFVANGVLAAGARRGDCGTSPIGTRSETCSLYVSHEGAVEFIATLTGEDNPDWAQPRELAQMSSRVSPDGRWLAFMSSSSLTGYDNLDVVSGRPDEEVFLYHAAGEGGGAGRVICASCDPTGARPHGAEAVKLGFGEALAVGTLSGWSGRQWLAASTPEWTHEAFTTIGIHQPRYLSDEGRLYFNSFGALAPQDTNGNEDVYEFEPVGVGSCSSGAYTFYEAVGGCVSLVSSGVASGESAFLDASVSGSDVFFLSSGALASGAEESGLKIYDAHECSSVSPCPAVPAVAAPECSTADSCRLAAVAQPDVFGAPASSTFNGAGNVVGAPGSKAVSRGAVGARELTRAQRLARALRACRKKRGKRRQACVRAARKRFGKSPRGARKSARGARKARGGR
jgi:NHL repeat/WD40-like Beta Propeller Repeat